MFNYVTGLINEIWKKEVISEEWETALIYPKHKKGDKQICDNYRDFALLNVTYKVFSEFILSRIKLWA